VTQDLVIEYSLRRPDGQHHTYIVRVDRRTLSQIRPVDPNPPPWVALGFHQCANCPLAAAEHPRCPLAESLVEVVAFCRDLPSYEEVAVAVVLPERTVWTHTTAQRGLASLMGLVMATSGCPHTGFLRPMARFHLPFASEEETIFRSTAAYLLAQYFALQEGMPVDLALEGLRARYRALQVVNRHVVKRLWSAVELDSSVNALVLLDLFSKALPDTIEDELHDLRYLFDGMLGRGPDATPVVSSRAVGGER